MKTLYIESCIERLKFGASQSDLRLIALAEKEVAAIKAAAQQSTQNTHSLIKQAQDALRSTGANWNEQCLFECDALLTEALGTQNQGERESPIEREWGTAEEDKAWEYLEDIRGWLKP